MINIEAQQPEFEVSPLPATSQKDLHRTGADLVSAMKAMPYSDVDFEAVRIYQPVRDVTL